MTPKRLGQELREEALEPRFERLKPLHTAKALPRPGDWLASHPEKGQSVAEYKKSLPVRPRPGQATLYLQPIGDFSPEQQQVVARTQDFLGRFFGLEVKSHEPLPRSVIPDSARRHHPTSGQEQLLTTYLLDEVLVLRRPPDAVAVLGLTAEDLYPDPSWNFVFGQASLKDRVGVWSIYRNGDPADSPEAFRLCLERTLKTAAHETGHMLGLHHCTAYECLMNGSNHREEADSRPMELCPACVQKLCWNVGCEPAARFERLAAFAKENGLDASYYEKARPLVAAP
jgi:archaemetzincin